VNDLGFDIGTALAWFVHDQEDPYVFVRISDEHAKQWTDVLGIPVRRCYVTDALLDERSQRTGESKATLVAAKLPDPGSTMAGDFGEILVYFYHAAKQHPQVVIGPKKWRLKQDRTKPAPLSDVVQFVLPTWPSPSPEDVLLCSEVKMKSTASQASPIQDAICDSKKDRTSRLARTLIWLRERALLEDISQPTIAQLNRFIDATDFPQAAKRFHAIAVVCSSLAAEELKNAPSQPNADCTVVVISVPELLATYNKVFRATHESVTAPPTSPNRGRE
jgi:hypothetical protein